MSHAALQPQPGPLWTAVSSLDLPEEDADPPVLASFGHLPDSCEGPDQNSSRNVSLSWSLP